MVQHTCSVDGCDRPYIARTYCTKHYQRWQRHGNPLLIEKGRDGARRYTLNEEYFSRIDSEEKSYWLGFITADGGIIRGPKTNALRVELNSRDAAHLERLAYALGSNKRITPTKRNCVGISFDSRKLLDSLDLLGIGPRKSAIVNPWNGPRHLMRHYWRGMFDGDGSIYKLNQRNEWGLSLIGSKECVRVFAKWACNITGSTAAPRDAPGGMSVWAVIGKAKPQALSKALYARCSIALDRKYQKYQELNS